MRVKTEFQIYERTHRSGNTGWMVSLGTVKGKRKFKSFSTREEAELFKAHCMEKNALKNPAALSELDELGKAAVRHAQAKLAPFDSTINEAVDFFLKFSKPPKGKLTIQEAIDLFKTKKKAEGASKTYLEKSARCFFVPFRDTFRNCLMSDISPTQAEEYIYRQKTWSDETKNTHNRHLRALYSFLITKKYATINPFHSVPFVKIRGKKVRKKVLSVEDAQALLQYALDHNRKPECAAMTLIFFCGVRVDEVGRLTWSSINFDEEPPSVEVDYADAKESDRRINDLPENAIFWLKECQATGKISPANYTKRMQRFRKKAGISYPQNAARHSFASYHYALHRSATSTASMLGHQDANLLYKTYRELVTKKEAKRYWDIVPAFVLKHREEEACKRDEEERIEAESQSNCGKAIRDENGHWIPCMEWNPPEPENVFDSSFPT